MVKAKRIIKDILNERGFLKMAVAAKGTTPDFIFDFSEDPCAKDLNLTLMDHVYVTFTSGRNIIEKWDDSLIITEKTIKVFLSQVVLVRVKPHS